MARSALAREDFVSARHCIRPLLDKTRITASTWSLACGIEMQARNFDQAKIYIEKALEQEPDNINYLYNQATVLAQVGQKERAVKIFRRLIALKPDFYQAYNNLANSLRDLGHPDEAAESYLKVLDYNLRNMGTSSHILISLHQFSFDDPDKLYELHTTLGKKITAQVPANTPRWRPVEGREKIRLGYISPRFSREIVGYFFKPVFDHHDRKRFELFLYNATPKADDLTEHFREKADRWTDVHQFSDTQLCQRLVDDEIDILIDLAGHAPDNRITAIGRKPSPVQVSMLDYFDTTGIDAMDYYVTDHYSTPQDTGQKFTEELIYLDQPRLVYEAPSYTPEVTGRAGREGGIVFGSFNRHEKISHKVVETWSALLREVGDSRLVLKNTAFELPEVQANFRKRFKEHGVAPDRLEFRGRSSHRDMFLEYCDIDIALDTFPYNGGLTTCEALWMGTPVIAMEGDAIISRQSACMLHSLGLPELVAKNIDEFVAIGKYWSGHRDELTTLHQTLRERMARSPLVDGKAYAQNLERELERVWQAYLSQQLS